MLHARSKRSQPLKTTRTLKAPTAAKPLKNQSVSRLKVSGVLTGDSERNNAKILDPPFRSRTSTLKASEENGNDSARLANLALKQDQSKILDSIRVKVERDSRTFKSKLKELEPTIRSLTMEEQLRKPVDSKTSSSNYRYSKKSVSMSQGPYPLVKLQSRAQQMIQKNQIEALGTIKPEGEKLLTVGEYILSLQKPPPMITTVVKPRVGTDKNGFEVELKITGCPPSDIKFEKRYDTLIVIGINTSALKKLEEGPEQNKNEPGKHGQSQSQNSSADDEYFEAIHELINIFVPKNVKIKAMSVSKPDNKGRILIKGP